MHTQTEENGQEEKTGKGGKGAEGKAGEEGSEETKQEDQRAGPQRQGRVEGTRQGCIQN